MVRKLQIIVVVMLATILVGCAPLRQSAIDISDEEVQNADAARLIAANYLSIWPIQSGFIKGALGSRMDELPAQAVSAIKELDELAARQVTEEEDWEKYSDEDLGLSLGLRVRLLSSVVQEALEMYAPEVLQYVPLLF